IVDRFADRVAQSERVEIEKERATTEHVVPNTVGRNRSFLRDAQNNVVDFFAAGAVPPHWPHRMNFEAVSALLRNLEPKNFLSPRSQEQPCYLFQIAQYLFPDLRRQQIVNFLSKLAQKLERCRSCFVIMAALGERAKFVGQKRDRFPARVVQLIAGRPMQGLLGQRSQIARIKTAPPERFDNSDPIMMLVSRHKIDIGRDQRAEIISK